MPNDDQCQMVNGKVLLPLSTYQGRNLSKGKGQAECLSYLKVRRAFAGPADNRESRPRRSRRSTLRSRRSLRMSLCVCSDFRAGQSAKFLLRCAFGACFAVFAHSPRRSQHRPRISRQVVTMSFVSDRISRRRLAFSSFPAIDVSLTGVALALIAKRRVKQQGSC